MAAADRHTPLWPHERVEDVDARSPCLRTQRRWVVRAAGLVGLPGGLDALAVEIVGRLLGLGVVTLAAARETFAGARDIRGRARAVVSLLAWLTVDASVLLRLLGAGTLSAAVRPAFVWDPDRRRRLFPAHGTDWPGQGRSRPPPSFEPGSPGPTCEFLPWASKGGTRDE